MSPLITGVILLATSQLIWFFGIRRYVVRNKGIDSSGANIAVAAWNDFTQAREIRKETKESCPHIETFAGTQIAGFILILIGVFNLT
ncbi:hypothetical protein [Pelagicoccus sp. SDUM812003]|uniref:hypothetical protein n=1 Tax=Pelagicoccus sp. SDUM812003 TaxID=3041267 RepID=UPI00280E07CF|nr:hypothetical protein [Pelagicoccus sp. SDUM812003]MDQ8205809.1 hypothetical protein [Pelagicoccus sp. SDUM812003]